MVGVFALEDRWRCVNLTYLDPYQVFQPVNSCFGLYGPTSGVHKVTFGLGQASPPFHLCMYIEGEDRFDYSVGHPLSEFARSPDGGSTRALDVRVSMPGGGPVYYQATPRTEGTIRLQRSGDRVTFNLDGELEESGLDRIRVRVSGWATLIYRDDP